MRVFLLMTMLLGLNVFSVQAKDDESLIKSFTLIKWDAVAHAKINEKECLLEFKHLPSGNLVTGVNYELAKGLFHRIRKILWENGQKKLCLP